MVKRSFDDKHMPELKSLLSKLNEHWGDCLWLDASELFALQKVIEGDDGGDDFGGLPG